jgi:LacI family transcriptional regulator
MATISDVARMAGVSTSTVSHVINGTKAVRAETKKRVERAIDEANFLPHRFARALRSGRSDSIGLVMSDTSQQVFAQVVAAVESEASKAGHTLLLANSREDPTKELNSVRALLRHGIDGLVIAPVGQSDTAVAKVCSDAGVPMVVIDRISKNAVDQVGIEDRVAMRALTAHLIDAGRRELLLIAGDMKVSTLQERHAGFLEAVSAANIPFMESSVLVTGSTTFDEIKAVEDRILSRRTDALIASSGMLSINALRAIRRLGMRIPEDIAFASFDGIANAEFIEPPITSVIQPVTMIGRDAITLLLERLSKPDQPHRTILTRPELRHGTSCGCDGLVPLDYFV